MEQSSRKKVLSFKGSGSALRVTFEGTLIPGIIEVMSELRDAGSLVTDHPLIIDFKELTVSQNWLRSFLCDVVFAMGLKVTMWAGTVPETLDVLSSLGFKLDSGDRFGIFGRAAENITPETHKKISLRSIFREVAQ